MGSGPRDPWSAGSYKRKEDVSVGRSPARPDLEDNAYAYPVEANLLR